MDDRRSVYMSLRHLRTFDAVVRTGRIADASETLHRSASAVSRSVALLEAALDCKLLHRDHPRFIPTAAGALVARRCAIIRDELTFCRNQLVRFHGTPVPDNVALFEMLIDCAHLKALVAVHDFRSVHRAAQVLAVSQPAVSYSLRQLESDVGASLFTRLPTGVIATPVGITLTLSARRILADVARMFDDVRSTEGDSTGLVCIGALAYSRTALLPQAIQQVLNHFPNISIRTLEGHIDQLLASLHSGELDLLLCAYPNPALLNGVDVEPITNDRMGLFVRAGHPLTGRGPIGFEALQEYRFIMPPLGTITRELLEGYFRDQGHSSPQGRAETSSYSLVRNLLIGSDHIAFRSSREFCSVRADNSIVPLDFAFDLPQRQICLLQRRGGHPTAAVRTVLDIVRETAG